MKLSCYTKPVMKVLPNKDQLDFNLKPKFSFIQFYMGHSSWFLYIQLDGLMLCSVEMVSINLNEYKNQPCECKLH